MRFRDLLRLSLSALWQQKVRTVLTTLGVVFGTFVLVSSLSVNRGVQETIVREFQKHGELRRIRVFPRVEPAPSTSDVVEGNMNQARRERLQRELRNREQRSVDTAKGVRLTPERLEALAKLEHVASVEPVIHAMSRIELNGKKQDATMIGVTPENKKLRDRVIAGEFVKGRSGNEIVVSELLLYQMGIRDDAALAAVSGQKARLVFGRDPVQPRVLLNLLNATRQKAEADELDLLAKILRQLPAAVEQMKLTPEEKTRFQGLLKPAAAKSRPREPIPILERDFVIAGVFRVTTRDDQRGWDDYWMHDVDMVMPVQTAQEIFFRTPAYREEGVNQAFVEADTWENVKELNEQIKAMGLQTHCLVEWLEREQLMYLLIFGAMTCVAGVALLVAGLSITNTMLISILERTREVGIMKAVGARDRHIQLIFLVEGSLIGLVGGGLGLFLGWAVSFPCDAWVRALVSSNLKINLKESIFVFPTWLVLSAPVFAGLVTTIAAVYPAWRAARVDPIRALRHE